MQKIKKLSLHEAQKIAAGEVVERPANVVKELLENAIDAGATVITLYVVDAGKQFIRVVDNGCGMGAEDARLCFDQYATSKIAGVNDLPMLQTFGFRGEALASIAAVSKITLLTKEAETQHGTKLTVACNEILSEEIVACNNGTDMSVADIFYNVPARKKFLKSSDTEWRAITQLAQAVCFAYQAIHIKVFHNDRLVYNCPQVADFSARVAQVWDHQAASQMVPILPQALPSDSLSGLSTTSQRTLLDNGIRITGAISNHHYARYDRSNIFFLVNKRWIKSQKLSNAVMKGYGNALMQGRFPAAAILVEIDSTEVDINIHPRKEEVAFLHPRVVEMAITAAVKRTLEGAVSESLKKTTTMHPSWAAPLNSLPFGPKMQDLTMNVDTQLVADVSPYLPNVESTAVSNSFSIKFPTIPTEPFLSEEIKEIPTYTSQSTLSPGLAQEIPQVLGQYNTTYILLETHEGLMLMDQHAAHERILYEKFATHFEEVAVVNHLFPQIIQLTLEDVALIALHLDMIKKYGIVADIFGDDQIIVSATPVHCKNISFEELVRQIVGWIVEFQGIDQEQFAKAIREKVHAQMACKAAVKAGDVLSREQMVQLVTDLFNTNNRFSCPHGRPTTCLISLHEIEKKFRRKL